MKCLKIQLSHCYGIKSLNAELDFESHGNVFAIYAPNGVMKTSFANTFQDVCKGSETSDRIWTNRETVRNITDEDDNNVLAENIFVIEPYNEGFRSDGISRLLVNDALRQRYEVIYRKIDELSNALVDKLKPLSGLKKNIKEELSKSITLDQNEFIIALTRVKAEVEAGSESPLAQVAFCTVFNSKVESVLLDQGFQEKIQDYVEKYDELVSKSTFFKKGVFTHNNAADIAKNLNKNGFFGADHSVFIRLGKKKVEIKSIQDLEYAIQSEKDKILTDKQLSSSFEKIDKQLTKNADLKKFRLCLEENRVLLSELSNPEKLKQNLWISYLIESKEEYLELMECIASGQSEINTIISEAKRQATLWAKVISIFNDRFSVPFVVRMDNQEDVILKSETPSISFDFLQDVSDDDSDCISIAEHELKNILSNGERRALYILNIIFEIEARKVSQQKTLFVVDDIADSFDYKNKYAIIEYLKAVGEEPLFRQVILSHNFDFYRTVSSRLYLKRESRMLASKTNDGILLQKEIYQKSAPFSHWRNHLDQDAMLIASIPFLRNLSEYSGDEPSFQRLTSLLHVKEDTDDFKVEELEALIKNILHDRSSLSLENPTTPVIDIIFRVSEDFMSNTDEVLALEDKVTLSIAIRLKAERFMIEKINDEDFWKGIDKNQTIQLMNRYKKDFPDEKETIRIFDRVNLMTPENIHLNSFMYEPILDLSAHHLRKLYASVSELQEVDTTLNSAG